MSILEPFLCKLKPQIVSLALRCESGIRIDHWPLPYKVKALYMCDENYPSVALQQTIPNEPKLFALVHELKHYYCDCEALGAGVIHRGDYDANELIEKGAEVFAAEFIYPEAEFASDFQQSGVNVRQASDIVEFKRLCKATVSYRFICKRLERLGCISCGQFDSTVPEAGRPNLRRAVLPARTSVIFRVAPLHL